MKTTTQNRTPAATIRPAPSISGTQAAARVDNGRQPAIQSQLDSASRLGHHFGGSQITAQDLHPNDNGAPLPYPVRTKMEQALDTDFSRVRVHEGEQATLIGAHAYARGNHLHFAPGAYRPHTPSGQRVIGHELVHVVQQRQQRLQPTGHIKGLPVYDNPAHETEADILGQAAAQGSSMGGSNNAQATQSIPPTASSPIQAIWRNKWTGETSTERPKRLTRGWEWIPDDADNTDSHPRGMKRTRSESDGGDASNDIMELDDSAKSGEEDSSDGDFIPGGASQRQAIDPRTVPINFNQDVGPATSAKVTTWSNAWGVQARAEQQGSVTTTELSGMRALPQGMTAKRAALEGKVKLNSAKKGASGGRKHNPNDTHSTHTAGMAMFGVPSQPGLGTGHDASSKYNQKYYAHENRVRALKGHTFQSVSEVKKEDLDNPARIKAIMALPSLNQKVTEARVKSRALAMKEQNPDTDAIANAKIDYTSNHGEKVSSGELGRDLHKGMKDKWFRSDYDPEDSSSDEDIRQGTNAKKRGRTSDEADTD